MLVACMAIGVPAMAQYGLGCPCECRNGSFEVDANDFDAFDYDATGTATPDNNPAPDHWSWSANESFALSQDDLPPGELTKTDPNSWALQGEDGWLWQCVDETLATWTYDDTDGWSHGENTCWREGEAKVVSIEYVYKFTLNTDTPQSLDVYAWAWKPDGEDPSAPTTLPDADDFDPDAVGFDYTDPGASWVYLRRWRNEATDDTLDWASNDHSVPITEYQPKYVLWAFNFIDPVDDDTDYIWLDEVNIFGECESDDAPELATWLLLACTGALGGVIRRRRKT
jgi:hypothetical protein